ncbi:hypothetical protein GCM10022222_39050 [Amycolatopsis ultiminotia]|uniref:AMP-dependent synthetase/ligase domain-containing protein n=1 Tax=Amycolatopsis ultiminotia TaxID=543629 RepID=A0ABP6WKS7_9PSEU
MYLTQGLHRAVQQRPDQVMSICGGRRRTHREVADRVSRLAGALRGLGVRDGDRVAMLALNSDRYSEYLLAVPWAGAVFCPVNTRWSVAEIAYSLDDCEARVLLVDEAFAPMLPALREACPALATVIYAGDGPTPAGTVDYEELIAVAEPIEDARRGGDELAGIFYTGGTTGLPKGVMLSHANLGTSWYGAAASGHLFGPSSVTLHCAPMFHIAGFAAWGMTLQAGGTHVLLPAFRPDDVLGAVAEHCVTDVLLVPTMIQMLVEHPRVGEYDLTSLRTVVYGASPIPSAVLERAVKTLRQRGHERAPPGNVLDNPLVVERDQRFADGQLADAELVGQGVLVDLGSRPQLTGEHPAPDLVRRHTVQVRPSGPPRCGTGGVECRQRSSARGHRTECNRYNIMPVPAGVLRDLEDCGAAWISRWGRSPVPTTDRIGLREAVALRHERTAGGASGARNERISTSPAELKPGKEAATEVERPALRGRP